MRGYKIQIIEIQAFLLMIYTVHNINETRIIAN